MSERLLFYHHGGRVRRYYRELATTLGIPCAGWLSYPAEALALYELAGLAPGRILEIGTYLGLSTCFLAMPGQQRVTTVDPHNDDHRNPTQIEHVGGLNTAALAQEAWSALGLRDRIDLVPLTSEEFRQCDDCCDGSDFGLVFIDGDHKPDACRFDVSTWADRVVTGGYLALHDYGVKGDESVEWDVAGVAAELLSSAEWFGPVVCGTVAWFQRKPPVSDEEDGDVGDAIG